MSVVYKDRFQTYLISKNRKGLNGFLQLVNLIFLKKVKRFLQSLPIVLLEKVKSFFQSYPLIFLKIVIRLLWLFPLVLLSACSSAVLLHSQGAVGISEKYLITLCAALMLIVVLPAIFMTFFFAWRYRESNSNSRYTPDWHTSHSIETAIWIIPSIIIIILSVLVWNYCHSLDPYRPISSTVKPINIEVVSLDWKWLFIYPDQQIATVNQVVFPANVPVHFYLTSETVMDSFFIPQLGSQIMTMGGMQSQLYLIANKPGTYDGISANFSGFGFTGMTFKAIATSEKQFEDWVSTVKKSFQKNWIKIIT